MLNNLLDSWFQFDVGEGAFYAIFGFLFVFVGICILIAIISLIGKIITTVNQKKAKKITQKAENPSKTAESGTNGELSPEIVAVISAAISSYYQTQTAKCDFVVRRIKRL